MYPIVFKSVVRQLFKVFIEVLTKFRIGYNFIPFESKEGVVLTIFSFMVENKYIIVRTCGVSELNIVLFPTFLAPCVYDGELNEVVPGCLIDLEFFVNFF